MIWSKFIAFLARYWHWLVFALLLVVLSFLFCRGCNNGRVIVFGSSERITVKVR